MSAVFLSTFWTNPTRDVLLAVAPAGAQDADGCRPAGDGGVRGGGRLRLRVADVLHVEAERVPRAPPRRRAVPGRRPGRPNSRPQRGGPDGDDGHAPRGQEFAAT